MGLLGFLKKKNTVAPEFSPPTQPLHDLNNDAHSSLGLNNSVNSVNLDDLQSDSMQLPELDIPLEFLSAPDSNNFVPEPLSIPKTPPSIVSNVPPINQSISQSLNSQLASSNSNQNMSNQTNDATVTTPTQLLTSDDLNHLFISDEWKEPDWSTFEPYTEDKIDEPVQEDFKGVELPQFEETSDVSTDFMASSGSVLEPKDPYVPIHDVGEPLELYIRGKAYARAFTELELMNNALISMESKTGVYSEILKKEEPLLIVAKDQMEYLYKRLNYVDKKIFTR